MNPGFFPRITAVTIVALAFALDANATQADPQQTREGVLAQDKSSAVSHAKPNAPAPSKEDATAAKKAEKPRSVLREQLINGLELRKHGKLPRARNNPFDQE